MVKKIRTIKKQEYEQIYANELTSIEKAIREISKLFDRGLGNSMSYNEGGSDFYNPLSAGMQIQQIRDNFEIIKKEMGYYYGEYALFKLKESLI